MIFKRIKSIEDKDFLQVKKFFDVSFPYSERKDADEIMDDIKDDRYYLYAVSLKENEDPIAILAYWKLNNCIYGEYLAVNPELRNSGIGKEILTELKKHIDAPMILEIEKPVDNITIRRKGFYERNGFVLNSHKHYQPAYHKDCAPLEMNVMTYPRKFSADEYDQFYKELQEIAPKFK